METKATAYNSIGTFSSHKDSKTLYQGIIQQLVNKYKILDSLDGEFVNAFEYLGYIQYYGYGHHLYEMIHDQIESEIYTAIEKLNTPDLAMLFDDIDTAMEDCIADINDWDDFRSSLFQTDEMDQIIRNIKKNFLTLVPEYDPYMRSLDSEDDDTEFD